MFNHKTNIFITAIFVLSTFLLNQLINIFLSDYDYINYVCPIIVVKYHIIFIYNLLVFIYGLTLCYRYNNIYALIIGSFVLMVSILIMLINIMTLLSDLDDYCSLEKYEDLIRYYEDGKII